MNVAARVLVAAALVLVWLVPAAPALAEYVGNPNRWPAFERVAPTARQVVIGRVVDTRPPGADRAWMSTFGLEVEEVPKGNPSTGTIDVDALYSGLPLRGEQICRESSHLYALRGDRIALALGGKLPGVKGRVNSAAWIEGSASNGASNLGLHRMTMDEVRRTVGLDPLPSLEAVLAGSGMTIWEDNLILEGVPAVAWSSAWPEPDEGAWDVATFAAALDAARDGLADPPTARLNIAGYRDPDSEKPEEIVLEVTDLVIDGDAVRFDFVPLRGPLPPFLGKLGYGTFGPASLTIDVGMESADS